MEQATLNKKLNKWANTNNTDYLCEEAGLSACFKYLVPKLIEKDIMFYLSVRKTTIVRMYSKPYEALSVGCDENSALALCKAVEKLI